MYDNLDKKIGSGLSMVSSVYVSLHKDVWFNRYLKGIKIRLYISIVHAILIYGSVSLVVKSNNSSSGSTRAVSV